jgi:hypothetical protein
MLGPCLLSVELIRLTTWQPETTSEKETTTEGNLITEQLCLHILQQQICYTKKL